MITIYGASDDLIEVEGDIVEEFGHYQEAPALLACSDGTLLRIASDREGVWRITRVAAGTSACTIDPGQDDRRHSDLVTLAGDIRWVVYADEGRDGRIVLARPVAGSQETTGAAKPRRWTGPGYLEKTGYATTDEAVETTGAEQ